LFVMDTTLPGQKMELNIFEPRYRLMVRRCMDGDRRMGMVGYDSRTGLPAETACEMEICECEPLPDGRFYLEVIGRRRFRIVKQWEQDGYRVGQVEWLQDEPLTSEERTEVDALAASTAELARSWLERLQERAVSGRFRMEFGRLARDIPSSSQAERLAFWVCDLLSRLNLMGSEDRLAALRCTNTKERLSRMVDVLRTEMPQRCRMQ